ncbi:MAG: hypothetical protein HOC71_04640 [Candidatus Latescibacteria bacterium]|nr:hypothetical protein [Candidatus Latescibacterota bacterium]
MHTNRIVKLIVLILFLFPLNSHRSLAVKGLEGRKQLVLEGNTAIVQVDLAGGSIVDFHLVGQELNPLNWNYPGKGDLEPRTIGHFICFDRWGQPSPQEQKNGMPFHGEAAQVEWSALSQPSNKGGIVSAEMSCKLPIGGLSLTRTMKLSGDSPVLVVREEITNMNKLGRLYNIVQHPSIAPPFLDESVIVDCNAHKGFMQSSPMPAPEEPVIYWPMIVYNGEFVDLSRLADDHLPGVTSFVFSEGEDYGWVTACNPDKGLLIGYIWGLNEYPWLNIWRNVNDGKPAARGLEFGTTGLHKPFFDLVAKRTIFDKPLYEYIDAGETVIKSYVAFLSVIPADYQGVGDIDYMKGTIVLKEKGENRDRDITLKYKLP